MSLTNPPSLRLRIFKHAWPLPLSLLLFASVCVARTMGRDVFYSTHFIFEIGIAICMFASVIYTMRLWRRTSTDIPRWVFFLNLFFGPLFFTVQFMISLLDLKIPPQ
jgi:hypothetical protein